MLALANLDAATSSVLINYPNGVPPFLSLPVMSGQKVIIRTQKDGYANYNETFELGDHTSKDIVLTPEPIVTTIAILLALAITRIFSRPGFGCSR